MTHDLSELSYFIEVDHLNNGTLVEASILEALALAFVFRDKVNG